MNSPPSINQTKHVQEQSAHYKVASVTFNTNAPLLEYMERLSLYLQMPGVTEVCINRPGQVEVESSSGWQSFDDENIDLEYCKNLARLIATSTGQEISEQKPILFASLPTNERVQVVIPPAVLKDTVSFSFRKPSHFRRSLDQYEKNGCFSNVELSSLRDDALSETEQILFNFYSKNNIAEFLKEAIKTHQNIVVSGATGAGKTAFMRSLISLIPKHERLITLENTDELQIWETHRNSVALFYSANKQGKNSITQQELLRSCLRMNPKRILLAELTAGEEAMSFINSINCGHPGSITSIHSNSSLAAFERLISLIGDSKSGQGKPDHVLRRLLHMTVDIVIQCVKVESEDKEGSARYLIRELYYDPKKKYQVVGKENKPANSQS